MSERQQALEAANAAIIQLLTSARHSATSKDACTYARAANFVADAFSTMDYEYRYEISEYEIDRLILPKGYVVVNTNDKEHTNNN